MKRALPVLCALGLLAGCRAAPVESAQLGPDAISDADFVALVERISEPGGYFDTDNLISNEAGYLKVMDALATLGLEGGAYVGVGPDQNFSYVAELDPDVVFITDIRRDNMLHHLLLKALVERAPTRVEFLAGLHGRQPPSDPSAWVERDVEAVVAYVDDAPMLADMEGLEAEVAGAVTAWGVPLSDDDLATIARFHRAFIDAGPSLRFTTYGRAPRWYYPTYRQLTLETDIDGDRVSYLATAERYRVVRELQLANKVIPVVGDMAGPSALREMGEVMREMGVELTAFYTSNVEFYLARGRSMETWIANLASMPIAEGAVVIRSYFPNFGGDHPSAVPGYYSTQTLQPAATTAAGGFSGYWDLVTRDAVDLRVGTGR